MSCLSCQIQFPDSTQQRQHMKSEWHRYNIKRKAVMLPPISHQQFEDKLKKTEPTVIENYFCCGKKFKTKGAYETHVNSKKHYQKSEIPETQTPKVNSKQPERNWKLELATAESEQEIERILLEKEKNSIKLTENDCLFCNYVSTSRSENMVHMQQKHSFFCAEDEDLEYLGDQISIANICIYCNGKGKQLHSLNAVRDHMISKGHCKLPEPQSEDDSSEWSDVDEDAEQDDEIEEEDESQMRLPSGRIGNRHYMRYWKQNIREEKIVPGSMKDLGIKTIQNGFSQELIKRQMETRVKQKQSMKIIRHQQELRARVGYKQNMLQHYYREQNPM